MFQTDKQGVIKSGTSTNYIRLLGEFSLKCLEEGYFTQTDQLNKLSL